MSNRISLNIDAKTVRDRGHLIGLLKDIDPTTVGVMDDLQLATDIKSTVPAAIVWHRAFGDSEAHSNKDPVSLAQRYASDGYNARGVVAYGINEPVGWSQSTWDPILNWTNTFLKACADRGVRAIGMNWGPALLNRDQIEAGWFDSYLRTLNDLHTMAYAGEHDYTGILIPWGGGWGGRTRDDFKDPAKIQPNLWPSPGEITDFTDNWHLHRGRWLDARSRSLGLRVAGKIISEFGWDRMPDWESPQGFNPYPYLTERFGTSGYSVIRGFNTLKDVWKAWFPQWTFERAFWEQMRWADATYPPQYLGFNIFQWCPGTSDWDLSYGFDMSKNPALHAYFTQGGIPVAAIPKPTVGGITGVVKSIPADFVNIRDQPLLSGRDVGDLFLGEAVVYYPNDLYGQWVYVVRGPTEGWVSLQDGKVVLTPDIPMPGDVVILTVPFVSQRGVGINNCPEASLTMVLHYMDVPVTLEEIVAVFDNDNSFGGLDDIKRVAGNYGVGMTVKTNQSLDVLIEELRAMRPVILLVERGRISGTTQYHPFTGAHFVVLVGMNRFGFQIHDPLSPELGPGVNMTVSPTTLLRAWESTTGNSGRLQGVFLDASPETGGDPELLLSAEALLGQSALLMNEAIGKIREYLK